MSVKRQYQAINDVLMTPATMIIFVAAMLLLTAAIGVVGGTKNKLLLLRVVRLTLLIRAFVIAMQSDVQ